MNGPNSSEHHYSPSVFAVASQYSSPTPALAEEMIDAVLRGYLTCADRRVPDAGFPGRAFDPALLDELPPSVDRCGERGEFHSFVWDGPMFAHALRVAPGIVVERGGFVFADVVAAD